jgi:hypothetical protein
MAAASVAAGASATTHSRALLPTRCSLCYHISSTCRIASKTPLTPQNICSIVEAHEHGGQARCRRSRFSCPAWFTVIPTRCSWIPEPPPEKPQLPPHPRERLPSPSRKRGWGRGQCQGPKVRPGMIPPQLQTHGLPEGARLCAATRIAFRSSALCPCEPYFRLIIIHSTNAEAAMPQMAILVTS